MREGRRVSQRRLFVCKTTLGKEAVPETQTQLHLNDLPEVLLIEIFRQLSTLPPVMLPEEEALYTRPLPFKTFQFPGEVHPGLRSYPFLGQVCRRWRQVMDGPAMLQLWSELVVDFGHELITGVHVPVAWSDVRPSDEDFQAAFAAVRLRSHRLVDFVRARRGVLRSLVLCHSEGFWGDDGEFVPLASKHDFSLGTLGILLGLVADKLTALKMDRCNDLFAGGSPISTIAMLRGLRSLTLDGLQCRVYREQLSELGRLTGLQQLCISAAQGQGQGMSFMCGVDAVPDSWSNLKDLRQLELRGHALLEVLPPWLPCAMPQLEALDVTGCSRLDPSCLAAFTQLQTLAMQALDLVCGGTPERLVTQAALHGVPVRVKQLPDLGHMTRLRALNLSDNNLCRLPPWLPKLRQLEVLDLSGNFFLTVDKPVPPAGLAGLRYLDLRQVHVEEELRFWSPAKCATMQHITALSKALRRKNRHCQVLYDTS